MSAPGRPAGPFAAVLLLSALTGAALSRGAWWAALAAGVALVTFAVRLSACVQRAFVEEDASRQRLRALVDERTLLLEQRSAELAETARRLEVARTRLDLTDRLAAVGRLAGGVAHEVNNPLAIALTNLSWLKDHLPAALSHRPDADDPPTEELLAAVSESAQACQRVADIVRDLQDFAQERGNGTGGAEVRHVMQHVHRLVSPEVRSRARLMVELPRDPLWVGGPPARLGQLLAHLCLHASRSVGDGGSDREQVRVLVRRDGDGALIEVRHTGRSLDPEALAHVFDPFYEAWSSGDAGRGLGLAVCHGLVGALGGEIEVEPAAQGALYRVRLPALTSQARLALRPASGDRPRVLVIDDEPLVVASLYRLLSRKFDVVPHTSPRQALAVLRAGERFDAVLCDVMMPELGGPAFHAEVARLRPALARQMVFLTGGAFTEDARAFLAGIENPRLLKPFEATELVAALSACCFGGPAPVAATG
jgi:signal transduction histidine kinase/CheY-like chemotaxis protein